MRSLGTWFSGGIDSVRLMVGLDDLEGLLQPKQFYDSNYVIQIQIVSVISYFIIFNRK